MHACGFWQRKRARFVAERAASSLVTSWLQSCGVNSTSSPVRPRGFRSARMGFRFLVESVFMLTSLATLILPIFKIVPFPDVFTR